MIAYADTSFLASLYVPDVNSELAEACLAELRVPLAFTSFGRLEFRNALRNAVARRATTSALASRALPIMESDLNEGRLLETRLDLVKLLQGAERLGSRHGEGLVIRCIDLLHVASAHQLGVKHFLTFDRQQAVFARKSGLTVRDFKKG